MNFPYALLLWILLLPFYGHAYCDKPRFHLFFANGMFNSKRNTVQSYNRLIEAGVGFEDDDDPERGYSAVTSKKYIAYNTDESLLIQLLEVSRQKYSDIGMNFWRYLSKQDEAPPWFQELAAETAKSYISVEYLINQDLRIQIRDYLAVLQKNPSNHILTVAHSQGNLFTNLAFSALNDDPLLKLRLNMISVATPASEVFGSGRYVTLKSDCIIRVIPTALPANTMNKNSGFCDHGFVDHYLKPDSNTRDKIGDAIRANLEASNRPPYHPTRLANTSLSGELKPFMLWLGKVGKGLDKIKLSPHQCLAIRMVYHLGDVRWQSDSCERRSLSGLKNAVNDCVQQSQNIWPENSRCPNFFADDSALTTTAGISIIDGPHPECSWDKAYFLKEVISPAVAEATLKFIENPDQEIQLMSDDQEEL